MNFSDKPQTYFWELWSLQTKMGRQTWHFTLPEELRDIIKSENDWEKPEGKTFLQQMQKAFYFDKKSNPNSADRVLRHLKSKQSLHFESTTKKTNSTLNDTVYDALIKGFSFYETLQEQDGNWAGDYGGPLFLMPGLIIASYVTKVHLEKPLQVLIRQNIWNYQNEDGGWGLHVEGESTMFGTVMQYVSLRILGEDLSNPSLKRAQEWILSNGGATSIAQWGKFYLSVLNVYEWRGNDALLPEMWLFPKWFPIHPGKYWCHNRMIFLPMSYCYGKKIKTELNPLLTEIREEIYTQPYLQINWKKARKSIHFSDLYKPISGWYRMLRPFLNLYDKIHIKRWRKKAYIYIQDYLEHEDNHTNYINIGPVNQAINSICAWDIFGKDSVSFKQHINRWGDYLWVAEDGVKMNGYNGSQLWDTAFAGQALMEANFHNRFPKMAEGIYHYIDITQIEKNRWEDHTYWRDNTIGCWPFSTREQAWSVTDCTSEGMKTALMLNELESIPKKHTIGLDRLKPTIDWLLSMQNKDGGWASYEKLRAPKWIEVLNPAALFENIMTEITYVECTSATLQGLTKFLAHYDYKRSEILNSISKGTKFIESKQNKDGSWYGSWGVCYTYGTWFSIEGLITVGEKSYHNGFPSNSIKRACEFLVSKQRPDGSWGESFQSCVQHRYIAHKNGQIVNTAWALMALIKAEYPDSLIIEKGINYLLSRQNQNGDFPQDGASGVFNGNSMISYTSYRNIFPLWALSRYYQKYTKVK